MLGDRILGEFLQSFDDFPGSDARRTSVPNRERRHAVGVHVLGRFDQLGEADQAGRVPRGSAGSPPRPEWCGHPEQSADFQLGNWPSGIMNPSFFMALRKARLFRLGTASRRSPASQQCFPAWESCAIRAAVASSATSMSSASSTDCTTVPRRARSASIVCTVSGMGGAQLLSRNWSASSTLPPDSR